MRMQMKATSFLASLCLSVSAAAIAVPAWGIDEAKSDCSQVKVHCVKPHAACSESEKVIETLQLLVKAYIAGDLKTYEEYLDDNCTTFQEDSKKLLSGKANVLADLKDSFEQNKPDGERPLLSFTIDQPYAKVTGDTAVVTFIAYRSVGGVHPFKEKSHVTDIFVKKDGKWKKLHYRGRWQKTKDIASVP
jgi:hypothetical protein